MSLPSPLEKGAVEYTDCFSAEGHDHSANECPAAQSAGAVEYT